MKELLLNLDMQTFYVWMVFACALLWQEFSYRALCHRFFSRGLGMVVLHVITVATVFTALSGAVGGYWMALLLMTVTTMWFMVQAVYHRVFGTVFVTSSLNMAGDALGSYWKEALVAIMRSAPVLLMILVPPVAVAVFGGALAWEQMTIGTLLRLVYAMASGVIAIVFGTYYPVRGMMATKDIYRRTFIPDLTVTRFGVLATLVLDVTQHLFGLERGEKQTFTPAEVAETKDGFAPNTLNIDFSELIAREQNPERMELHRYFASKQPTYQNMYTGKFKGKNLILMTGEAFWRGAVSERYTPTLYRLAHEGFVFNNFYNPLWYYSTVDGEYANTTGLVPSNRVNASQRYAGSHRVDMRFSMGNQLRKLGYETRGYHNNVGTYYDRYLSHPNLGYDFKASDTGLDVEKLWPQSDLQMMELTVPEMLAGKKPFHTYYMTVSGHLGYNFSGNDMAKKHEDEVADLQMSEGARAYIACNMELDRAMEYLLKQLEEAGELENTVICLSGDHYPYGLDDLRPALDELTEKGTQDSPWEKHRSTLILWSGDMAGKPPVVVDKYCSTIDVLPTLSNLFGVEYDARLMAGRDILSTADGYVPFNNYSFIGELGRYDGDRDVFYPNEGAEVPEGYAAEMYQRTKNVLEYSSRQLFVDYYGSL